MAKKLFGKLHLWLGFGSGLVVVVVGLTGCLYVFEEEIRQTQYADQWFVRPESGPKLSVPALRTAVEQRFPNEKIKALRLYADPARSAQVLLRNERVVSVHPYTGQMLGTRPEHDWLHTVLDLHRTLLLGEAGKVIIQANTLIFIFMVLSGIVLWWPKARQVRSALTVLWRARWRRLNYDVHRVLGFYASLGLLVIALTGSWWAFKSVQKTVYALAGAEAVYQKKVESKPVPQRRFSPEQAFAVADARYPGWTEANISVPNEEKEVIRVLFRYPHRWARQQNVLHFDQFSGEVRKAELRSQASAADYVRLTNYDLHTGRLFGLPGKILAFLASLFAASLPVTGFLIWRNRQRKACRTLPTGTRKRRLGRRAGPLEESVR